jgi:hypothetical protein
LLRVQVVELFGAVIAQRRFNASDEAIIEGVGPVPLEAAVFSIVVEFPDDAAGIRIVAADDSVLAELDPLVWLLRDAVATIPDACLAEQRVQSGNALLGAVNGFEHLLASGGVGGVIRMLERNIRRSTSDEGA